MSWVSPTGYEDPDSNWNDETNAYDDNEATYADSNPLWFISWSKYLILTHAALTSDKVRFLVTTYRTYAKQIDLDVYDGSSWTHVYQGEFTNDVWVEKTFTQQSVTKVRMRFYNGDSSNAITVYVREFDFWEVSGGILKEVSDSLSLSDVVSVNKTLIVTDSLSMADSVLRNKPLVEVLDTLSLSDVVLVNKTMTVQDVLSIADAVSVETGVTLKEVLDTLTLQDLIKVNKSLQVSDSLTLQDFIQKVGEILLNKTKLDKAKLDKTKRDK